MAIADNKSIVKEQKFIMRYNSGYKKIFKYHEKTGRETERKGIESIIA